MPWCGVGGVLEVGDGARWVSACERGVAIHTSTSCISALLLLTGRVFFSPPNPAVVFLIKLFPTVVILS